VLELGQPLSDLGRAIPLLDEPAHALEPLADLLQLLSDPLAFGPQPWLQAPEARVASERLAPTASQHSTLPVPRRQVTSGARAACRRRPRGSLSE